MADYIITAFYRGSGRPRVDIIANCTLGWAKSEAAQMEWCEDFSAVFIEKLTKKKIRAIQQAEYNMRQEILNGKKACLYIWDAVSAIDETIDGYLDEIYFENRWINQVLSENR